MAPCHRADERCLLGCVEVTKGRREVGQRHMGVLLNTHRPSGSLWCSSTRGEIQCSIMTLPPLPIPPFFFKSPLTKLSLSLTGSTRTSSAICQVISSLAHGGGGPGNVRPLCFSNNFIFSATIQWLLFFSSTPLLLYVFIS